MSEPATSGHAVNALAMSGVGGRASIPFAPSLTYALRWRVAGVIPGAHPGSDSGQSGRFRQTVPFDRSPDPRRIDLRATVRDPLGILYVRQFDLRAAARVEMLIDVSASMAAGARTPHFSLAVKVAVAIAVAAAEIHDNFGLAACAEDIAWLAPSARSDPRRLAEELARVRPSGNSARGLLQGAERLVGRRKLVFLVSDFAFPLDEVEPLLSTLSAHDVVPIQITEDVGSVLPAWGLAEIDEPEGGGHRFVLLRPGLRARWQRQEAERRRAVAQLCMARGRRPFVVEGSFDVFAFADYLLGS